MKQLAIAFTLLVAACGGKSSSTTTTPENTDGAAGTMPADSGAEVVTLRELHNGDIACYVVFTRQDGSEGTLDGDFGLCEGNEHDASGMIGQQVTLRTEKADVQAQSCQGNPSCRDTEQVDLVVEITAAAAE